MGGPRRQPACRVPIGRLPAALRPKGGKEARGCSRARAGDPAEPTPGTLFPPRRGLGDPRGGRVWCRRLGGCVGSAPPTPSLAVFPPPPRLSPALAPMVGLRQRSGGTRGAPRRPGEWPGAAPRSPWSPAPAFAFPARARWGLPGQCLEQLRRPRRRETWLRGEVRSQLGGFPSPAGRVRTGGAGPTRRFVSGRGDLERTAAPRWAAPFPPLLPRAAARRVGRVTERESLGMWLRGLPRSGKGRGWPRWQERRGSREVARGCHRCRRLERDASSEERSVWARASFFRCVPGGGKAGWACVQRKGRRGGQSLPEPVLIRTDRPAFGDADLGVPWCPAPRAHEAEGSGASLTAQL